MDFAGCEAGCGRGGSLRSWTLRGREVSGGNKEAPNPPGDPERLEWDPWPEPAVGEFEAPPSRWRGRVGDQGFGASHLPARGGPSN